MEIEAIPEEQFVWCIICQRASRQDDWPQGAKCPRCEAFPAARYEWAFLRRFRDWLPEVPDMETKYGMS